MANMEARDVASLFHYLVGLTPTDENVMCKASIHVESKELYEKIMSSLPDNAEIEKQNNQSVRWVNLRLTGTDGYNDVTIFKPRLTQ